MKHRLLDGRTQILLVGGGELVVQENPRQVEAQVEDAKWSVLSVGREGREALVRSTAVVGIIDLEVRQENHLRPVA